MPREGSPNRIRNIARQDERSQVAQVLEREDIRLEKPNAVGHITIWRRNGIIDRVTGDTIRDQVKIPQ